MNSQSGTGYVWNPSPGHSQTPIWPGPAPDAMSNPLPETVGPVTGEKWWAKVAHVSRPTMTVYTPKGHNSGAAVVVFPGGGYQILAIDIEGTEICDCATLKDF